MIGKILEKIKGEKEALRIEEDSVEDFFEDRRSGKLQQIDKESESLRERTEEVMEDLEKVLEDVEGFEDEKDRSVITDVVSNVVEERKKLVDKFEIPANIESLEKEFRDFLRNYQEITQKEGAVIEEAGLDQKFGESLKEVKELHEEIREFVENKYQTRKNLERVREKLEELEKAESELNKLEERLDEINLEGINDEIEEKESKLDEIGESEEMDELESLRDELEKVKSREKNLDKNVSKALSNMQRGLKKLLYEGEVGKISKEGSKALREIRDQKKEAIMERDPEVIEEAVKAVKESLENELEGKTKEKLLKGIQEMENFSDIRGDIKELNDQIEELEEEIESHEAVNRKKKIEDQIEKLKEKLEDKKERREELKEEISSETSRLNDAKEDIQQILEKEFNRPVEFK